MRASAVMSTKIGRASMYVSVLFIVAAIATSGYKSPVDVSENKTTNASLSETQQIADIAKPSVDQISVVNLASKVADNASLTVSTEVFSQYMTLSAQNDLAQTTSESTVTKPQVFDVVATRGFETYKTVAGDTVNAIADKYSVSAETIRWANNLSSDALTPDKELVIPPVDGVVYMTKDTDTLESIATKYQSDTIRIISQNDLELTGLKPNTRLIIPGGVLPESERPGYVAPRPVSGTTVSSTNLYNSNYTIQSGNRYSYGYCTWYAYNRRAELGMPIGSLWGHAATWAYAARSAGYLVDNTPAVGAVMQNGGGYGHVAVVEQMFEDGSFRISEMNYAGWNIVSSRTLTAGQAGSYSFIHTQ